MQSSRKEDQLVSRYKRSWCIQVLHLRIKKDAVSRAKEKRARDKALFMRQLGRGQLWGDSE